MDMNPNEMICMRCKRPGHGARYCPSKTSLPSGCALDEEKTGESNKRNYADIFGSPSSSEDSIQDNCIFGVPYSSHSKHDTPDNNSRPLLKKLITSIPDSKPPAQSTFPEASTLSQRHQEKEYQSKSAEYKANQQWKRFVKWWEDLKATGAVSKRDPHFLEPEVFDNLSDNELSNSLDSLMFHIDHLQRAHLISLYVEQLTPIEKGSTHLDGGTIKGYVDAIVRKLWSVERTNRQLSSRYGNWSWKQNNEYVIVEKTIKHKVETEDTKYRGQKQKGSMTSDSVTIKSWKLLIDSIFTKRDKYKHKNDLSNFIKTNASLCVHIHTLFCGCRAQDEITNLIVKDFVDHTPNCIEFRLSGDFKTRKLGANFNFIDRLSSFIFSEKYCDLFRIFMNFRAPNSIDRFFLYHQPSARFGDKILLSQAKPIGPKPLSQAVKKEITKLVEEGLIASGIYSNTSLRKGLSDALSLAYVPPVIVDLAVGHFNSKSGQTSVAFTSTPNLTSYVSLWKQAITRKKIALLLFDSSLKWQDICDKDAFHSVYKTHFPGDFHPTHAPSLENEDSDNFCFENEIPSPLPLRSTQPLSASRFNEDEYPDELFLAFLTPPELRTSQQPAPVPSFFQQQPAPHQSFAQRNTAVQSSITMAPVIHIHGGTVTFNFGAGPNTSI